MTAGVTTTEARAHLVQFFVDDDDLVAGAGPFLARALLAGEAAVVLAVPEHRRRLNDYLVAAGFDTERLTREGRVLCLDAAATLSQILTSGRPDPIRFEAVVGHLVQRAGDGGRGVSAFGELVGLLWNAGQVSAALELEELWSGLAERVPFALYCAYPSDGADGQLRPRRHLGLLHIHSGVVGEDVVTLRASEASFPPDPDAARRARHFVRAILESWGASSLVDDALTVVTELASNAVTHARSAFSVSVAPATAGVRLEVRDAATSRGELPALPFDQVSDDEGLSGRGLRIVDALSTRWDAEPVSGGKVVWAELGWR